MSTKSSIAQQEQVVKAPVFVVEDGCHFNAEIGEWEVWLGGQIVNYATHQSTAWAQYNEALRVNREHVTRNIGNRQVVWTVR